MKKALTKIVLACGLLCLYLAGVITLSATGALQDPAPAEAEEAVHEDAAPDDAAERTGAPNTAAAPDATAEDAAEKAHGTADAKKALDVTVGTATGSVSGLASASDVRSARALFIPFNVLSLLDDQEAANGADAQPATQAGAKAEAGVQAGAATESAASAAATAPALTVDYSAQVPALLQYPEMPAGCEIYSLTSVLQALGFNANPHDIAREHVPYAAVDGNPVTAYNGSPYENGEGLPPAIVRAGNSYLASSGSPFRFSDATGTPFEELSAAADGGLPVLVWTTVGIVDPGFSAPLPSYTYYSLEHCVVLLGSDPDGSLRIMDPQAGYLTVDAAQFAHVYEQCGSMAATLGCAQEVS